MSHDSDMPISCRIPMVSSAHSLDRRTDKRVSPKRLSMFFPDTARKTQQKIPKAFSLFHEMPHFQRSLSLMLMMASSSIAQEKKSILAIASSSSEAHSKISMPPQSEKT